MDEPSDFDWIDALRRARTYEAVRAITLTEAREIGHADGATFIVRDGEFCVYIDEDAVGPLWRGQRFPIAECIGGWAMLHAETVEVPDVLLDDRISHAAYRPTFVRSLVMIPMGTDDPRGAVGVYWSEVGRRLTVHALTDLAMLAGEAGRAVQRLGLPVPPQASAFDLKSAS